VTEPSNSASKNVQSTLKTVIEANLARERAIDAAASSLAGAHFSNGIIFSRSGNGTPHSNGIFFSRVGVATLGVDDPIDAGQLAGEVSGLDEAAFNAFTERLLKLKQTKAFGRPTETGQ
jgi:hypothetical protein